MAISEKTILDPEASKPGIPLKKSTLLVIVLLVLALGFISSLVLSPQQTGAPTAPGPVKEATDLKRTGTDQMLKDEEELATRLKPAAPVPPLPPSVRRDDNTSALFDNKGARPAPPPDRSKELELEAQTRMAKALVTDFDPPRDEQRTAGGGRGSLILGDAATGAGAEPSRSESPVRDQIDAFRKQIQAGATGGASPARSKADWIRDYAEEATKQRGAIKGYQTAKRLVLRQGKVIPAVLGRQINSDLPGVITAFVSTNVYDAGGQLLIPMGASLVGKYDSGVAVGQTRVMFAFERLILPNGYSFNLPAAPGADLAGAAGMTGDVDNHFFKMFGTSLLIAVLGDRVEQPSNVTQVGASGPVTAAGQVLSDVSKTILERNRVIPPTITVEQGTRINVEVVADMLFPDAYRAQ